MWNKKLLAELWKPVNPACATDNYVQNNPLQKLSVNQNPFIWCNKAKRPSVSDNNYSVSPIMTNKLS